MRTETTVRTVYRFDELDERAQERALSRLYELNVDHDWWDPVYSDAKRVGLKITGFDAGYRQTIDASLTLNLRKSIQAVKQEHGQSCETWRIANDYEVELDRLDLARKLLDSSEEYDDSDELDRLEAEYEKELAQAYLTMLGREYEYLTSRESIIESIQANGYELDEDGSLI